MPNQNDEIAFTSGLTDKGTVAGTSYWTWNKDNPDTYNTNYSYASKWGASTTAGSSGDTQYYFFDPASHWTATEQKGFSEGLALWSAVANIKFISTTNASAASLKFVRGTTGTAITQMYPPGENVGSSSLNTKSRQETTTIDTSVPGWQKIGSFTDSGGYNMKTVIHEEGHFLGLGHAGAYDGNVNSSSQQYSAYDTLQWSIMSYIDPADTTAKYYGSYPYQDTNWNGNVPTTWMPDDILAAQRLYGVATSTPLSGGQTFGFNCNVSDSIKSFFDFSININPVVTLYDTGTGNTLDLSGYNTDTSIDLRPGAFSSFDGMINNLSIAYGTIIEGYNGSAGNDVIMTNDNSDTINGGGGINQVIFIGRLSDYAVSQSSGFISITKYATGVTDRMVNIQSLRFSDQVLVSTNIGVNNVSFYQTNFNYNTPINTPPNINILNLQASYGDLIHIFGLNYAAMQNWYNTRQATENRSATFNGLNYVASHTSLITAFKYDVSATAINNDGARDYIAHGFDAGLTTTFNGLDYVASYPDLIVAIGVNNDFSAMHFIQNGYLEGRVVKFDGLDYIASYQDLIHTLGVNEQAGSTHFINYGYGEGRAVSFDGLDYIASYHDLMQTFGANEKAGSAHFITNGDAEGRTTTFSGLDYVASYSDLIVNIGHNNDAGAMHFIQYGYAEGRGVTFDGLNYIASYRDLINTFGANENVGASHFISNGYNEGRSTTFDGLSYIAQYKDLMNVLGANNNSGAAHYITNGANEGRTTAFDTAGYIAAHSDLAGVYKTTDSFLSAYITTFQTTGHFLT